MKKNNYYGEQLEILEAYEENGIKKVKVRGNVIKKTPTVSVNGKRYTLKNVLENVGKKIKYTYGHPALHGEMREDHLVGEGVLKNIDGALVHEGWIMDTSKHPDTIKLTEAKLFDASLDGGFIRGAVKKVDGRDVIDVAKLNVDFIGMVAKGSVPGNDFLAVAESIITEMHEMNKKDKQVTKVDDGESKDEGVEKVQESISVLKEQLAAKDKQVEQLMESQKALSTKFEQLVEGQATARKEKLIESVISVNKDLKKEDLEKLSESELTMKKQYEAKLAELTKPAPTGQGIVMEGVQKELEKVSESERKILESVSVDERYGEVSMTEPLYESFHSELANHPRKVKLEEAGQLATKAKGGA